MNDKNYTIIAALFKIENWIEEKLTIFVQAAGKPSHI